MPTTTTTQTAQTTTSATPSQDPAEFVKQVIQQRSLGQYGRSRETLHPVQRTKFSRTRYIDCESASDSNGIADVKKVEILDVYDEMIDLPGHAGEVPSKAVTLRVTATTPAI